MSQQIDPAAAIALARQYRRVCLDHPDQRLNYHDVVLHVLKDVVGPSADNLYRPSPSDAAALARLSKLALALILGRDSSHGAPEMAVYLTIDHRHKAVVVDYGHHVLELMAAANSLLELIDFAVADLPADLVRAPYWDGEKFDRVGLSELPVERSYINNLFSAEIHVREVR